MNRCVVLLATLVATAGCGTATSDPSASPSDPPDDGLLYAEALVLEDDKHGPQLCVGGVMTSDPPQCGGPDLPDWDWDEAGGFTSRSGVTWGEYVVVGRYDGAAERFVLDRPAVRAEEYDGPRPAVEEDEPIGTPCAEPEGGWRVVEPARTTEASLTEVQRAASQLPGFAEFWYDQSINPAYGSEDPGEMEMLMNDPEKLVVNVSVTGDVDEAEAELRDVWGGALCVSQADHTEKELRAVQKELMERGGWLGIGTGQDHVDLTVVHDDGSLQDRLDAEYGVGLVRVSSALQPYPG